jgi:hypothetical protein
MNEMIERVAQAMHGNRYEWPRPEFAEHREDYRAMARKAIEAMREPTEAMLDAIEAPPGVSQWRDYAERDWHVMIDAALK